MLSYLAVVSGGYQMGVAGILPLIRVVDGLETDVLLILKGSVELGVLPVEGQLRAEVVDVLLDKLAIAFDQSAPFRHITGSCVPRTPSPACTPRRRLSSQFVFAWASFKTIGCPSCRTLWMVIRALNVWTSSARIGCLVEQYG
jgi:hypothetical protein